MEVIGTWCWGTPGCACENPMPVLTASAEQRAARAEIVAYLVAAPLVAADREAPCRFASCAFAPLPASDYSDGAWLWPATMAHYVEVHDLALPDAMVAHMRARAFAPPLALAPIAERSDVAWRDFAKRAGPRPALVDDLRSPLSHLHSLLQKGLRPLGYWASSAEAAQTWLPHPTTWVDRAWDGSERDVVAAHLRAGSVHAAWKGHSPCRFANCGVGGSRDLTDGVFVWPEGLAHYLEEHGVRLPAVFVAHVLKAAAARGPQRR